MVCQHVNVDHVENIMKNNIEVPVCDVCEQPIWNPHWWKSDTGMCGVCTLGESIELFHPLWIAPSIEIVNTDAKFMAYWQSWYQNIYLPEQA